MTQTIVSLRAQQVLDSRGTPTLRECCRLRSATLSPVDGPWWAWRAGVECLPDVVRARPGANRIG